MEDDNTTYEKSVQLPEVTVTSSGVSISDGLDTLREARNEFSKGRMHQFDARLYRKLIMYNEDMMSKNASIYENTFYPHFDYGSYVTDFYEAPDDIQRKLEDIKGSSTTDPDQANVIRKLEYRKQYIEDFINKNQNDYLASRSFIHPYAIVKLAGAYGNPQTVGMALTYDRFDKRRFYEIDGETTYSGHYAKNPTTSTLIRWGNESEKGKTPYSFQDFVFCRYWNKIENNRLITLRRYAAPVTDNIAFADYKVSKEAAQDGDMVGKYEYEVTHDDGSKETVTYSGRESNDPWTPLATAVTYFGEGTENRLSDILSFTAGYNWKSLEAESSPIDISSHQNDAGSGLINNELSGLTSGLGAIAKFMGFMGEVNNGRTINLDGAPSNTPEDPYSSGPYENRILGPINVIMNTYKRERGLHFSQEGLKITFDYVSRPIAGVNNKAVLLDLMSNILVLTYSSGSWFGGMWRYRAEGNPAIYPWKYGDAMNKLYKGQIFGNDGAIMTLTRHVFSDGKSYLSTFLPDVAKFVTGLFKSALDSAYGLFTGDDTRMQAAAQEFDASMRTGTFNAIQKVIAAKVLRGSTIPYIRNQRALLTGEPVGDWHLTIGNPLNPIAMIGNLIVKDVKFEWSDELGPDDFPIGFKAIITLDHGLGRDRDAIESMFNRGFGRIYTLSKEHKSSADSETRVDKYTNQSHTNNDPFNKQLDYKYEEIRNTYFGGGTRFIANVQHSQLSNKGYIYTGSTQEYQSLKPTRSIKTSQASATYYVNPWQMGYTL